MKPMTLRTKGHLKTNGTSFAKTRSVSSSKPYQSGMTLIEVLVAMFVLAIGVLALLAIQLRTVSSVREAEGQTIVSQLTQNLVEGMLINPRLEKCDTHQAGATKGGRDRGWCKNYRDYYTTYGDSSTEPLKKGPLKELGKFHDELKAALPDSAFYYSVCQDSLNKEPTYDGAFHENCDKKAGADTVIKVLWLKDLEGGKAASDVKTYEDSIIYTYQVRVREK